MTNLGDMPLDAPAKGALLTVASVGLNGTLTLNGSYHYLNRDGTTPGSAIQVTPTVDGIMFVSFTALIRMYNNAGGFPVAGRGGIALGLSTTGAGSLAAQDPMVPFEALIKGDSSGASPTFEYAASLRQPVGVAAGVTYTLDIGGFVSAGNAILDSHGASGNKVGSLFYELYASP